MATIIKPKRTTVGGNVPTTSEIVSGEIAVNLADKKLYVRDTGSNILELTTRNVTDLDDTTISSPSSGQVLKYNGSVWTNQADAEGSSIDDAIAMAIALG